MKYLSSLRLVLLRHKFRRMFRGNLGAQPSESTDSAKGKECRQSWITMSGSRTAFIRCHPDLPSEERPRLDWATVNVQIPHKASAPPSDSQGQSALRPGACRRRRYAIEAVFRSWKSPRAQSYRKLNGISDDRDRSVGSGHGVWQSGPGFQRCVERADFWSIRAIEKF